MNREYFKTWSQILDREMEMLVFGHAGAKVLVFPTRKGRFYEYENLGLVACLQTKIDAGHLQLFCVDSLDEESLYNVWAHPAGKILRHIQFEQYILQEVLPFMHIKNPHECVIAHGMSLGAYHAVNITLRHPKLFKKLVAFSGRYDLTLSTECFDDLFSGFYNDDIYFNTPSHFLPGLDAEEYLSCLRAVDITLVIGDEDPFLHNNEQFSLLLKQKNIHHDFWVWQGRAHSARYWRQMAVIYI